MKNFKLIKFNLYFIFTLYLWNKNKKNS
jgi:hypothetical protein